MITPLTPQSIPQSAEYLRSIIDKNNIIYRFLYREVLLNSSLENYVFTKRQSALQDYYLNNAMLFDLLNNAKKTNTEFWQVLEKPSQALEKKRDQILKLMNQDKSTDAQILLMSNDYLELMKNHVDTLNEYYRQFISYDESSAIDVMLAVKNTTKILNNSLNVTLIIFLNAILISILFAFFVARAISYPIDLLRNNMERMEAENLSVPVNPQLLKLRGEVGDLSRSFSKLIEKLRMTTVLRDELLIEVEGRKKYEEKLNQTAVKLQELNQELDQFAYIASHDLRAPLRAIEHLVTWIEEDCCQSLPVQSRENFDLLKARVKRLNLLIGGILDYSREGTVEKSKEKIDTNKLLAEVIDNLSPPSPFTIKVDQTMPVLMASRVAMEQVFLNLISNAIKYHDHKQKACVNIGYETNNGYYQFYVKDNGPGIHPKFHKRIFEIFQTLQPVESAKGTGIGLAIVKKIVEKQGGKIWVLSKEGEGATFYFTWPMDSLSAP